MSETSNTPPEIQKQARLSRRGFLGLAIRGGAALALSSVVGGDAPSPAVRPAQSPSSPETSPHVEREPKRIDSSLIVDIPPTAENIQEAQDRGLITHETEAFDLPSFFNRLTGANYEQLEKEYTEYKEREKLISFSEYLLQKGMEKEALCLMLSKAWSSHGVEVAETMRHYRETQEDVQKIREQNPRFPNDPTAVMDSQKATKKFVSEPYELLPLQDFISSLEKSERTDEFGNPYYYVTVDHQGLAQALKKSNKKIINCSLNFGKIPIRIGYTLRDGQTKNVDEGWSGDVYDGDDRRTNADGTVSYGFPPIAIESAYRNNESLEALKEFALQLTDKTIVAATGNSSGEVPESFEMPENVIMVGVWNDNLDQQKPVHDFTGKPGTVYYADPSIANPNKKSSFATAMIAEWLCEQEVTNSAEAKKTLDRQSKIKVDGNWQVLNIGLNTTINRDWEDQGKYRSITK